MSWAQRIDLLLEQLEEQQGVISEIRHELTSIKSNANNSDSPLRILPLKTYCEQEPELSGGIHSMRWLIQKNREALLGLKVIVLKGNRILIDHEKFVEYLVSKH